MGWLAGWEYQKSHTITGPTGAQTNYPSGVKVYYGAGVDGTEVIDGVTFGKVYCNSKCKTDFGDIRFTNLDGITLLDHWLQEKVDSDYAIFWVEVDSIPASPSMVDIYVYYDNPVATTISDGDDTFTFFDDFTKDRGWTIGNGTYIQIIDPEDILWIDYRRPASNLYCYRPVSALTDGFELLIDSWYDITPAGDDWSTGVFSLSVDTDGSRHGETEIYGIRGWGQAYGNKHGLIYWNGVGLVGKQDGDADPNSDRFVYRIRKHDTRLEYYCSSANVADGTEVVAAGIPAIAYMKGWITNSQAGNVGDDCRRKIHLIRIRKWVFPEPTHTAWGPETAQPSVDLKAIFHVGQDSVDLKAEFTLRQLTSDLYASFSIPLPGEANLFAKFETNLHHGTPADLYCKVHIRRIYDLSDSGGLGFFWQGVGRGHVDIEIFTPTGSWIGMFPDWGPMTWVALKWEDLVEVDIDGSRPDKSQVTGILWTYHSDGIRRVDWIVGLPKGGDRDVFGKFIVRHSSYVDLKAEFAIRRDGSQDLKAHFWIGGHEDLKAEFEVRQTGATDLFSTFIIA